MKNEQEVVRSVFDAYIRDIKAVSDKDRPTIDMLEEVKNRAIKALEQPTSDDCVSIAELEKWLDLNFSFGGACRKLELFDRLEKELPRVTPTRKSGLHWIERFDDTDKWLECPHCHKDSDNAYAYCPNCGANIKRESNNG